MATNLKKFNVKAGLSVGSGTIIDVIDGSGNATFNTITGNYIKSEVNTVATLESAVTVGAGTRSFVTDADTTTFGSIVGGSGSNTVPVWSNGANWLVG
jgi:hypothetical protein